MRLREIKSMLKEYEQNIGISSKEVANSTDKFVFGLQKSINNIEELSDLGFLNYDIKRLKKLGEQIYYARNADDKIKVDSKTLNNIVQYINIVKEKISGFQTLIDNSIPENRENVINIKLPNYKEVEKLAVFYKNLDLALRTGLRINEINGSYKLQNFDSGSFWTEIVLNNKESIIFFGVLIKTAIEISKNSIETKIAIRKLEQLNFGTPETTSFLEETLKEFDKEIDKKIDEKIEDIQHSNEDLSPESKANIRKSIKTISDLLDEGTKFYPSLEDDDEVKVSFPVQPEQLNEPQKLLKENALDEND